MTKRILALALVLGLLCALAGAVYAEETEDPEVVVSAFFFDEERRNEYFNLVAALDFDGLRAFAEAYIAEAGPAPDDQILSVAALADEALALLQDCDRNEDPVENITTITFIGVSEISDEIHVVPILQANTFRLLFGFIADDWLFFDQVILTADGEMVFSQKFKHLDIDRDILDGGQISEKERWKYDKDDILAVADAENSIIRFKNTDTEEHLDFAVSPAEADAIRTVCRLWQIQAELRSYYAEYFHQNPVRG